MTAAQNHGDLMYRLLVEAVTDCAIYMLSPTGHVVNWNAGAERSKGYRAEEIVGRHYGCLYTAADRQARLPGRNLRRALELGRVEEEGWRVRKDGTAFWAEVVMHAVRDDAGTHVGFAKITRDCTRARSQALALAAAKDRLDLAIANLAQGLCLLDDEGRITLANDRLHELLGLAPGAATSGVELAAVLPGAGIRRHLDLSTASTAPVRFELDQGGRMLCAVASGIGAGGWVVTFDDVTDRRRTEDAVRFMAANDALTRLPNRDSFNRHLDDVLAALGLSDRCALLHIDLDRFTAVNDVYGHATGDALLREVASRLDAMLGPGEAVFRIGADEFAMVMPRIDGITAATDRAARVIETIARPFVFGMEIGRVGASVGIALGPDMGLLASDIARKAGMALYQAKRDGRGCSRIYGDSLGQTVSRRRSVEVQLGRALQAGEFDLHYQPIVEAWSDRLTGFEVLLRWTPRSGARMRPDEFIPIAEEMGLMPELGGWILETACREAASWARPLAVSVNVSATQLREAGFIERVAGVLQATGLEPRRLELEITETAMIEDHARTLSTLCRLREMGVLIALDDFGTGYSSLSFLQTFPLTRIKVDKSFVKALDTSPQSLAIVRAVTRLARDLGLAVTAEGVETQAQREQVCGEGCSEVQGYLIARPMPLDEMRDRFGDLVRTPATRPAPALASLS